MDDRLLTSDTLTADPSLLRLYMRIAPDRFDAMIFNPFEDHSLIHRHWPLNAPQSAAQTHSALSQIENIVYDNPLLLNGTWQRTSLTVDTPHFLLIPTVAAAAADGLFKTAFPDAAEDKTVLCSPLEINGASVAMGLETNLLNFLRRTFTGVTPRHILMPFVNYVRSKTPGTAIRAYLNLHPESMELAVTSATTLYLATRFDIATADDAAYYTLASLKTAAPAAVGTITVAGNAPWRENFMETLRRFHPDVTPMIFPSDMHRAGAKVGAMPMDFVLTPLENL